MPSSDYYINFVMLFVGGVECFAAGWIYNIEEQIERLGATIVIAYMTTTFGSVTLACALWFGLSNADDAVWAGFVGLVAFYGIGMAFVTFLMHKKKQANPILTWKGMYYDLVMRNVMDLRRDLSEVVGYMPSVWGFLVKHFIPQCILILFALGADANITDSSGNEVKEFGHYEGYVTRPYQVLGILIVVFTGFLFFSSLVFPKMYDAMQKPEDAVETKKAHSSIHAEPENDLKETSAKEDVEAQQVDAEEPEEMVERGEAFASVFD